MGGAVSGRRWRRGGEATGAKAGGGLDRRADHPVVPEVSIRSSHQSSLNLGFSNCKMGKIESY